jgi:hypothetical protein
MNARAFVLSSLFLITGFENALAQKVTVFGAGAGVSCGSWLQDRKNNRYNEKANWVLGFLAGAAIWSNNGNFLGNTDTNGIFYWIDKECFSKPTLPLVEAAAKFVGAHSR